jgi:hypothetical protein
MKRPKRVKISLWDLRFEAQQAPDSPDLDPRDREGPIVFEVANGQVTIVDGYHRTAGMINWALGEQLDLRSVFIDAIDVTGFTENIVAAAAVPEGAYGMSQEEAIEKIVKAARGR